MGGVQGTGLGNATFPRDGGGRCRAEMAAGGRHLEGTIREAYGMVAMLRGGNSAHLFVKHREKKEFTC